MGKSTAAICVLFLAQHVLFADETPVPSSWRDSWTSSLGATWNSENHTVALPLRMYHVRSTYDDSYIDRFNEAPWGIGVERFFVDAKRNRHSFYAMAFKDSYSHVEPIVGYAWEKNFHLDNAGDMRIGLGYSAAITARHKQHYIPFPGAVPSLSLNYKSVSLQTTWVPYVGHNSGNVFMTVFKIGI